MEEKKIGIGKRVITLFLAMTIMLSIPVFADTDTGTDKADDSISTDTKKENSKKESLFSVEKSYFEYISENENTLVTPIEVKIDDFSDSQKTKVAKNEFGYDGSSVVTEEDGYVTYKVKVENSGYYSIDYEYFPMVGKGINIEREVLINGKRPYFEARNLILSRIWRDRESVRENTDNNGNEMRPKQVEVFEWFNDSLKDGGSYYAEPMLFYLEKGNQEIKIISVRESAAIRKMVLNPEVSINNYVDAGYTQTPEGNQLISFIEAETPIRKSSSMVIPMFDRASPLTSPRSSKEIKLNIIGGERWKIPGQWVEYEIDVPKDGLYKLGFRARQNIRSGAYSSRALTIDGKSPFTEAGKVRFDYSTSWQTQTVKNGDEECLFELTQGKHVIRLEAILGNIVEYLDIVQGSLSRLNASYREILMLTGPTPDLYRDYYFLQEIPQVFENFKEEQVILKDVLQKLEADLGYTGENLAIFNKLDLFFNIVLKDETDLVKQMKNFENHIGALATWIMTSREQPLDLDGIYFAEANYQFPKSEAGFFKKIAHELRMFGSSFTSDLNAIKGDVNNERGSITVWTSAARDHVNILRQMIDEDFSSSSGIDVNLQLVTAGSLLPSTLAGIGPDVSLSVSSADVMNYAARGAILDLGNFEDLENVKSRFKESALIPMKYDGGFYGIPETQTFPVMFYRKDILGQMGIEVPKTWQEMYLLLTEIQKKNMTFGLKTGMGSYPMFLSQMGGEFYKDNNSLSNIGSDISVNALRMQSDMFVSYQLPQKYDFANRFRTGQIPIGIEDYTTYNLLTVFAPEIRGLWGFTEVPGIEQPDGTINNTVTSGVSASVILSSAKEPDLAYEFLKWLSSAPTQMQYGRELETILGTAARYNSANVEAVKGSTWSKEELVKLDIQWNNTVGIPEVPGGYYTSRYIDFSFRDVAIQQQLPRETLMEAEDAVNEEMKYKRLEFGLDKE